jgi:hypothetical protein
VTATLINSDLLSRRWTWASTSVLYGGGVIAWAVFYSFDGGSDNEFGGPNLFGGVEFANRFYGEARFGLSTSCRRASALWGCASSRSKRRAPSRHVTRRDDEISNGFSRLARAMLVFAGINLPDTSIVMNGHRTGNGNGNHGSMRARRSSRARRDDFAGDLQRVQREFEGRRYTGMKIGAVTSGTTSGDWKETKVTPDSGRSSSAVTKRRAGKAPEGSGVPVGTSYHWYILAHPERDQAERQRLLDVDDGYEDQAGPSALREREVEREPRGPAAHLIKVLQRVIEDLDRMPRKPRAPTSGSGEGGGTAPKRPPAKRTLRSKHTRVA